MRFLFMVMCVAFAGALGAQEAGQPTPGQLRVTGEGRVTAAPDMATLTLGVTETAPTARDAMAQVSDAVELILDEMTARGIAPRDVQTSGLNLSPNWSNSSLSGKRGIDGYVATNQVTIRVRALEQLGEVLEAALSDGVNQMSGLRFGFQEPRPLLDEARRRAVADAQAKADLFAKAAGVTLGPLLELSETGAGQPEPMMAMAMARESMPIAAGESALSAGVVLVFQIP